MKHVHALFSHSPSLLYATQGQLGVRRLPESCLEVMDWFKHEDTFSQKSQHQSHSQAWDIGTGTPIAHLPQTMHWNVSQ